LGDPNAAGVQGRHALEQWTAILSSTVGGVARRVYGDLEGSHQLLQEFLLRVRDGIDWEIEAIDREYLEYEKYLAEAAGRNTSLDVTPCSEEEREEFLRELEALSKWDEYDETEPSIVEKVRDGLGESEKDAETEAGVDGKHALEHWTYVLSTAVAAVSENVYDSMNGQDLLEEMDRAADRLLQLIEMGEEALPDWEPDEPENSTMVITFDLEHFVSKVMTTRPRR
jgi:hypothetical protein